MLQQIVEEMKATARKNPHNQDRVFLAPQACQRILVVDGLRVHAMLTFNEWDSIPAKAWQLSLSREDSQGLLDEERTQKLVLAFLGLGALELTAQMPPMCRPDIIRQFMLKV